MKNSIAIKNKLKNAGLKITPQRMAILDAVMNLKNHPTAELITEYVRKEYPNLSVGTVYKTLEVFSQNGIIKKVLTDRDIMRYDAETRDHHHLYSRNKGQIRDYYDEELDALLQEYFKKKKINNFKVEEIKLHLTGEFTNNNYSPNN